MKTQRAETTSDGGAPGSGAGGASGTRGSTRANGTSSDATTGRPPGYDPVVAGYYANLELPYGADLETVEAAWKRLMRSYHPDLHGADPERQQVATELVQGLNRAYSGLREHLERV